MIHNTLEGFGSIYRVRCVNRYPIKMISIFFCFTFWVSFPPPCTRKEFFFWFSCAIGQNILVLFSFTDPVALPRGPASHGQARARQLSNPSQVNHGSPPACRWRYLWLFFNCALLSFMPAYQHVSGLFGGFDTSVVQIDGRAASAIYVSLRCATPHCSFHTTSSLPQPTSETSHISTCTACHHTCTT